MEFPFGILSSWIYIFIKICHMVSDMGEGVQTKLTHWDKNVGLKHKLGSETFWMALQLFNGTQRHYPLRRYKNTRWQYPLRRYKNTRWQYPLRRYKNMLKYNRSRTWIQIVCLVRKQGKELKKLEIRCCFWSNPWGPGSEYKLILYERNYCELNEIYGIRKFHRVQLEFLRLGIDCDNETTHTNIYYITSGITRQHTQTFSI